MSQWAFVAAAYAVMGAGGAALAAWAYLTMRRAERR